MVTGLQTTHTSLKNHFLIIGFGYLDLRYLKVKASSHSRSNPAADYCKYFLPYDLYFLFTNPTSTTAPSATLIEIIFTGDVNYANSEATFLRLIINK